MATAKPVMCLHQQRFTIPLTTSQLQVCVKFYNCNNADNRVGGQIDCDRPRWQQQICTGAYRLNVPVRIHIIQGGPKNVYPFLFLGWLR